MFQRVFVDNRNTVLKMKPFPEIIFFLFQHSANIKDKYEAKMPTSKKLNIIENTKIRKKKYSLIINKKRRENYIVKSREQNILRKV